MPKLICEQGGSSEVVELSGTFTMGRLSSNDFQIKHGQASRQHARIVPAGGGYVLEDLNSANGTFVNGERITRHRLQNGDTIGVGSATLHFQDVSAKLEGGLIAGKFRIQERIGQGGMGAVYKAEQTAMDRTVAIKLLKPELTRDQQFVETFISEARLAGKLNHPNIITVHDFGEARDTYFMAMEYVEGQDAQELLNSARKLPPQKALHIARKVAEGLAHAHEHGIVHRDVKPQNIMLTPSGEVKLADLGLAKGAGDDSNRKGVIMGTPHYMAPEVAKREPVTGSSDLYSLGATLYHLITGRVPFDGPNSLAVITKHINQDLPSPKQYDATLSDDICNLIGRLMAKDPADRPRDAAEAASLIGEIVDREAEAMTQDAHRATAAVQKSSARPRRKRPSSTTNSTGNRPSGGMGGLITLGVVILVVVIVLAFFGQHVGNFVDQVTGLFGQPPASKVPQNRERQKQVQREAQIGELLDKTAQYEREGEWLLARRMAREAEDLAIGTSRAAETSRSLNAFESRYAAAAMREWSRLRRQADTLTPEQIGRRYDEFRARFPGTAQAAQALAAQKRLKAQQAAAATNGGADPMEEAARKDWSQLQPRIRDLREDTDFVRAERLLEQFLQRYPGVEAAAEAQQAVADMRELARRKLEGQLEHGRGQAAQDNYAQARRLLMPVVSARGYEKLQQQAEEELRKINEETKSRFEEARERATADIKAHRFEQAIRSLNEAAGELAGTHWETKLQEQQRIAHLCGELFKALGTAVEKQATQRNVQVQVKTDGGTREPYIRGGSEEKVLLSLSGHQWHSNWSQLDPMQLGEVFEAFLDGPRNQFLIGAYYLGRGMDSCARSALVKAVQKEDVSEEAAPFLARLVPEMRLAHYDWTSWRQMSDWYLDGDWSLHEEGSLRQQTAAIDAAAQHTSSSYSVSKTIVMRVDLTVDDGQGLLTVEVVQDDKNRVGVALDTREGAEVFASVQGKATSQRRAEQTLPRGQRLELILRASPDELRCSLNGEDLPPVKLANAESLRGQMKISTRGLALTIHSIQIRQATVQ